MKAAKAAGAIVSLDLNFRAKLWQVSGGLEKAQETMRRIVANVDVLVGNEEDLQKGLGLKGPDVEAKKSIDPSAFFAMMDQVAKQLPNIKIVATTLREVVRSHREEGAVATVLAAVFDDPTGYGRVVTDGQGRVRRIVEETDADAQTRSVRRINTGVFCFRWPEVRDALERLAPDNVQGERYLTDVMEILAAEGAPGTVADLADPLEVMGINDRVQLARAEAVLRDRIRRKLMREGVTFLAPETTLVDDEVAIGPDTVIYPGVVIEGGTSIGRECVLGPFSRIVDADVGRGVELKGWNHVVRTTVPNGSILEPYVQQGQD